MTNDGKLTPDEMMGAGKYDPEPYPSPASSGDVDGLVAFQQEAARYFRSRDIKGEDSAHWANIYNAENCEKTAEALKRLREERDDFAKWWSQATTAHHEALAERDAMAAALEFYRDEWDHYKGDSGPGGNWPSDPTSNPTQELLDDAGSRARAALNQMEEQDER